MLEKIKLLLKKRFSDLILIIAVIAVFFLTGRKRTEELSEEITSSARESTANSLTAPAEGAAPPQTVTYPTAAEQAQNTAPAQNTATTPPPILNPNPPQFPNPATNQNQENSQPGSNPQNPYQNQNIFPGANNTNNNLGESLKNLKGNSASTEDIVNRNAYFQKLSKQLNELQGDVSSEGGAAPQNNESNNAVNEQNNIPVHTEENYIDMDGPQGDQPYPDEHFENNQLENPYGELNRFPPPEVIQ